MNNIIGWLVITWWSFFGVCFMAFLWGEIEYVSTVKEVDDLFLHIDDIGA